MTRKNQDGNGVALGLIRTQLWITAIFSIFWTDASWRLKGSTWLSVGAAALLMLHCIVTDAIIWTSHFQDMFDQKSSMLEAFSLFDLQ